SFRVINNIQRYREIGTRDWSRTRNTRGDLPGGARRGMCETNPIEGAANHHPRQPDSAAFGVGCQSKHPFDVVEIDGAEIALDAFDGAADQAAGGRDRQVAEGVGAYENSAVALG